MRPKAERIRAKCENEPEGRAESKRARAQREQDFLGHFKFGRSTGNTFEWCAISFFVWWCNNSPQTFPIYNQIIACTIKYFLV